MRPIWRLPWCCILSSFSVRSLRAARAAFGRGVRQGLLDSGLRRSQDEERVAVGAVWLGKWGEVERCEWKVWVWVGGRSWGEWIDRGGGFERFGLLRGPYQAWRWWIWLNHKLLFSIYSVHMTLRMCLGTELKKKRKSIEAQERSVRDAARYPLKYRWLHPSLLYTNNLSLPSN